MFIGFLQNPLPRIINHYRRISKAIWIVWHSANAVVMQAGHEFYKASVRAQPCDAQVSLFPRLHHCGLLSNFTRKKFEAGRFRRRNECHHIHGLWADAPHHIITSSSSSQPHFVLIDTKCSDCDIITGISENSTNLPPYLIFRDHRCGGHICSCKKYSKWRGVIRQLSGTVLGKISFT